MLSAGLFSLSTKPTHSCFQQFLFTWLSHPALLEMVIPNLQKKKKAEVGEWDLLTGLSDISNSSVCSRGVVVHEISRLLCCISYTFTPKFMPANC